MVQVYNFGEAGALSAQIGRFEDKLNEYLNLYKNLNSFQDEINKTYDLLEEYIEDFKSSYSDSERGDEIERKMEDCKSFLQEIQAVIENVISDVGFRNLKYTEAANTCRNALKNGENTNEESSVNCYSVTINWDYPK